MCTERISSIDADTTYIIAIDTKNRDHELNNNKKLYDLFSL
jgi:hypothetical protein